MRAALAILFALCLSVAAQDAALKKPTLAETLAREKHDDFEDTAQDAAEQIEAVYWEASEDSDKKAIKEAFKAVSERIMERARK